VSLNGDDIPISNSSSGSIPAVIVSPLEQYRGVGVFGGGKLKPNHRQTRSLDETPPPGQSNGSANNDGGGLQVSKVNNRSANNAGGGLQVSKVNNGSANNAGGGLQVSKVNNGGANNAAGGLQISKVNNV